jgi:prolyl-tRNA synthetase
VVAQSGAIGGDVNHEFMVPSVVGEDHFARCSSCGYAANVEAAVTRAAASDGAGGGADSGSAGSSDPMVTHDTPDTPGIDQVVDLLRQRGETFGPEQFLKSMAAVDSDGAPLVILVPGNREARVPHGWRLFEEADFVAHSHLVRGYIGPPGLQAAGVRVVADESIRSRPGPWVTGSNQVNAHVSNVWLDRDFTVTEWGSYVVVQDGDLCPECDGEIALVRSVEAAHTFQLGLRYSSVMEGATYLTEEGKEEPMWMGCYGMGMSRLLAIVAEEHHDDAGLIWPMRLAPYAVHLLSLGAGRNPAVAEAADQLYAALTAAGVETLYDDRDVSPGIKFADADLLGMPYRLLIGAKGLERGMAEVRQRADGADREMAIDEVAAILSTEVTAALL